MNPACKIANNGGKNIQRRIINLIYRIRLTGLARNSFTFKGALASSECGKSETYSASEADVAIVEKDTLYSDWINTVPPINVHSWSQKRRVFSVRKLSQCRKGSRAGNRNITERHGYSR